MTENAFKIKKQDFEALSKESLNVLFSLCLEAKKHAELIKTFGSVPNLPPLDKVTDAKEQLIITEKTALCLRLHYINIFAEANGFDMPFPEAESADAEKITEHDYTPEAKTLEALIGALKAAGASPIPDAKTEAAGKEKDGEKISENPDTDIMIKVMLLSPANREKS